MSGNSDELRALHETLSNAFTAVTGWHNHLPHGIGMDTCFAVGEAAGHLAKAKALVGRDIDAANLKSEPVGQTAPDTSS